MRLFENYRFLENDLKKKVKYFFKMDFLKMCDYWDKYERIRKIENSEKSHTKTNDGSDGLIPTFCPYWRVKASGIRNKEWLQVSLWCSFQLWGICKKYNFSEKFNFLLFILPPFLRSCY